MTTRLSRVVLVGVLAAALPSVGRADDVKPDTTPAAPAFDKSKGPDFSGYAAVTTITAEIVKAGETSATVRVYWLAATAKNGKTGRGNRPPLHQNHGRTSSNPYATRRPRPQAHWEHHDYELEYLPESLVRTKSLPTKFDGDGKKATYSEKERDELKVPYTVPGYRAAKADLTAGTVVELFVIRDKSIPAAKVTENDLRLKYVLILGQDPNPPKDITNPKTAAKK